jgi:hypothetical protein
VEGTLIPLGLFLLGLHILGIWGDVRGLGFVYVAIATRLVMRRRVPGLLDRRRTSPPARLWPSPL